MEPDRRRSTGTPRFCSTRLPAAMRNWQFDLHFRLNFTPLPAILGLSGSKNQFRPRAIEVRKRTKKRL
jgi:hypothetical protein